MSMAGAQATRRSAVEREFQQHAVEIAAKVAEQFRPVYERVCRERDEAIERAAVLQTVVELIALERVDNPYLEAQKILDQLGIVPDIEVAPADDATQEAADAGEAHPQAED